MRNWLILPNEEQVTLFNHIGVQTNLPPQAVEKDAGVTLILRMLFTSSIASYLIFKGGTSLSKAFHLIERFSEDIDIGIDRKYLGFTGELTKGEIRKLRKASHTFVSTSLVAIIQEQLAEYGVSSNLFELIVKNTHVSDQDPETIEIIYQSVFSEVPYLRNRVLIEISARSLIDPNQKVAIKSIIDEHFPDTDFTEGEFTVNATNPQKTFLEKLILLQEEFQKPKEKIRHLRMSRHLYDLGQILNSEFGETALQNTTLFERIIEHRKKFTPMRTTDYGGLTLQNLQVIPPAEFIKLYQDDYREMHQSMIHGKAPNFDALIGRILEALQ
ncbi:MAG: putative nucleotidyltransferase component of viral defense system [Luteibaculaceae bacterium]|jgi:predicted nucleotidyltransferase component of viral defense system